MNEGEKVIVALEGCPGDWSSKSYFKKSVEIIDEEFGIVRTISKTGKGRGNPIEYERFELLDEILMKFEALERL